MLIYRKNIIDNKYFESFKFEDVEQNISNNLMSDDSDSYIYKIKVNNIECILKLYKLIILKIRDPKKIYINIIKDVIISNKVKYIIETNICPNFVYFYNSNVILKTVKNNSTGKTIYDFSHIYNNIVKIDKLYNVMEYYDGSLIDFFNKEHNINLYKSLIFQMLCMIYCFQKYINMYHMSFTYKNILFKKIDKNIIIHYKINDVDYYVPSCGYLFMLCDYQRAKQINTEKYGNHRDLKQIIHIYHRPIKNAFRVNNIKTVDDLLKLVKIKHIDKIYSAFIYEKSLYDYKIIIKKKARYDKLFSKLVHVIIDEKLIDYEQFYTRHTEEIVNLLKYYSDNIFRSKDKLEDLLYKHFTEFFDKPSGENTHIISFNL